VGAKPWGRALLAAAEQNLSQRSRWCRWKNNFCSDGARWINFDLQNKLSAAMFAFAAKVSWVWQFTAVKRQNLLSSLQNCFETLNFLGKIIILATGRNHQIWNWKWWFPVRAAHNLKLWLITRCDREGGGQKWSISIGPALRVSETAPGELLVARGEGEKKCMKKHQEDISLMWTRKSSHSKAAA